MNQSPWICPVCSSELTEAAAALVCANHHTFDLAREGHVNLLIGRQSPKLLGDSKAMLQARRRFQKAGHYEPLRRRLAELVQALEPERVLEVGCGTGYYLGDWTRAEALPQLLGTDIAKDAIRLASKDHPEVHFAVADTNAFIPLPDASVDVILDIFAPRNRDEFARILRPTGCLIVVIPTDDHLAELRKYFDLLSIESNKQEAVVESLSPKFKLISSETLRVKLNLDPASLRDLVGMTPSARFNNRLQELNELPGEVSAVAEFEVLSFARLLS